MKVVPETRPTLNIYVLHVLNKDICMKYGKNQIVRRLE